MIKGIIFDLDLTLVDSSIAENARKNRNWPLVYSLIPSFTLYDGFNEVFKALRTKGLKVCVVSTSPRPYVERVIRFFNIPCDYIVGYHDAKPIKPHPAPMLKALELLSYKPEEVLSLGDRVIDIKASNAAGIKSIACFWGTNEEDDLKRSGCTSSLLKPEDILTLI